MVGWALRPCNRSYNLNRNCRVGCFFVGWAFAHVIGDRNEMGIVGWDIVWWDGLYAHVIGWRIKIGFIGLNTEW